MKALKITLLATTALLVSQSALAQISERTLRYRLAAFREAGLALAGAGR